MMNVADTKTKTCQIKCINKIDRFSPYERGDDEQEWDYAERMNDGPVHRHENPWRKEEEDDHEARAAAMAEWEVLPERN